MARDGSRGAQQQGTDIEGSKTQSRTPYVNSPGYAGYPGGDRRGGPWENTNTYMGEEGRTREKVKTYAQELQEQMLANNAIKAKVY